MKYQIEISEITGVTESGYPKREKIVDITVEASASTIADIVMLAFGRGQAA